MGTRQLGDLGPGEHARHLVDPTRIFEPLYSGSRAAVVDLLSHLEMYVGLARDLGQVSDGEHLARRPGGRPTSQSAQLGSQHGRLGAADPSVHFIENQGRPRAGTVARLRADGTVSGVGCTTTRQLHREVET